MRAACLSALKHERLTVEYSSDLQKFLAPTPDTPTLSGVSRTACRSTPAPSMIPALIPPATGFSTPIHDLPSYPPVPAAHTGNPDVVYGVCTVGEAGRISDRHLLRSLGWHPGASLNIRPHKNLLIIHTASNEKVRITSDGYFRVPYRQRRTVCLFVGDRVLLLGHRQLSRLIIHPPGTLDDLLPTSFELLGRQS